MNENTSREAVDRNGYYDPEVAWLRENTKDEIMTDLPLKAVGPIKDGKTKAVVLRAVRTAIVTLAALLAVWVTGPAVLGVVADPVLQSLIIVVIGPALAALGKARRMDDGV